MFVGRKEELSSLESVYGTDRSNLLVLYGREGIGKTALALSFAQNKRYIYKRFIPAEKSEHEAIVKDDFERIKRGEDKDGQKHVLIIDEFHLTDSKTIFEDIIYIISNPDICGLYTVLMLSSSINFVENSIFELGKEFAASITGIIKIKPLSFAQTVEWFPNKSVEELIIIRSLLGGVPKYLSMWDTRQSTRDNIIRLFLKVGAPLQNEAEYLLRKELRELGSYNTILISLGRGLIKLNDLFLATGYSRAKISVYIKNLIEMNIVEKIYSAGVKNADNTMKGLYRISDELVGFCYAFVYPNLDKLEEGQGQAVYDEVIAPALSEYLRPFFADVCREYLDLMSKFGKLDYEYSGWQTWYGKKGTIDIIGEDDRGNTICGLCSFGDEKGGAMMLAQLKFLVSDAGIKNCRLCLFAKNGFSDEIIEIKESENLIIASLQDF